MSAIKSRAALALSIVLIVVSAAAADGPSEATEARAIETLFSRYKDALLQENGAKAADIVSAGTIAFYEGIRSRALTTPRAKLADLDFMSRLMVLRVRHEFTKSQIEQMDGRKLLATGVDKGWISKSTVADIAELVDIKVNAPRATASIPAAQGIPLFHFVKESGQWKLDLTASFAMGNEAMKHEVEQSGMTEDEFIIRVLSILSSSKLDERVFSPPGD